VLDHVRAYWHEAGHVLVARRLGVPVAGVIYTNLKRLPDTRVSGNLVTVYYTTRETNAERRAAEEADWVRHFGIDKVCTASAGGTAAVVTWRLPSLSDEESEPHSPTGICIHSRSVSPYYLRWAVKTPTTLWRKGATNGNKEESGKKEEIQINYAERFIPSDRAPMALNLAWFQRAEDLAEVSSGNGVVLEYVSACAVALGDSCEPRIDSRDA
jgi:hypothetical protein